MPFGEIVIGSPGSGKSTYAYGKHQLFTALNRPISIVNLDPANDNLPYPCAIDINTLITLQDVMDTYELGPNGSMLYCMEYLDKNFDWLESRLKELGDESWIVFDLPGQVELSTNHGALKSIIEKLGKIGFRLAAVHLCDAHYVTDAAKYISVLLLSLRVMLQLELPHINVLSKVDLITQYGDLDFNLDFYTEVQDLSYLTDLLNRDSPRFSSLNMALASLIEDFGLVGFETLAVEDKNSMVNLTRIIDRSTGYVFVPKANDPSNPAPPGTVNANPAHATQRPNTYALFSTAMGSLGDTGAGGDIREVQERWVDYKEQYDAFERKEWRKEGELAKAQAEKQTQKNMGALDVDQQEPL